MNERLRRAQTKFKEACDSKSQMIISVENIMRKSSVHAVFEYEIPSTESCKSSLIWDAVKENKKNWRIFLQTWDNVNGPIRKPLIEQTLKVRLKCIQYIPLFVEAYTNFLEELTQKIENTASENKPLEPEDYL